MTSHTIDSLKALIKKEGNLSIFISHGFVCVACRRRDIRAPVDPHDLIIWCGYVGIGPDHPAYGKRYDDLPTSTSTVG